MDSSDEIPPPPYSATTDDSKPFSINETHSISSSTLYTSPMSSTSTSNSFFNPRRMLRWLCGSSIFPLATQPYQVPISNSPRKQYIETHSTALSATFNLFDLLSIRSWSGSIDVRIEPQPADKENPAPAELRISSHSGSIDVTNLGLSAPEREYITSINSHSGSINADIIHGTSTSVSSHSGSITLRLTAQILEGKWSSLSTSGRSGHSKITLRAGTQIENMSSVHTTASGHMKLRYPREWSGTIEGSSGSGNMRLHGPGVEIIRQTPHEIFGKKGDGNSRLVFRAGSGSVDVYFD